MQEVQHNMTEKIHEIRFCNEDEYHLLIDFLDKHWKKDHIFTRDKTLLDWQHLDQDKSRYNFVVAYNQASKEFDALLGFIPSSQYDQTLKQYNELWLAIWKVKEGKESTVSGLQLLFYLNSKLKPSTICSIGITDNVKEIYDALKYKRGDLTHYFIASEERKSIISKISPRKLIKSPKNDYIIKEISYDTEQYDFDHIIESTNDSIVKSSTYIKNKFIDHPTYTYKLFGIFLHDELTSFFIARNIEVGKETCMRIVDYYGTFIDESLYDEYQMLLQQNEAEYIDLLCHIPDDSSLIKMGFLKKEKEDIIPEYFEPFVQKNVTIDFAYKSKKEIRIFKADSDQDRPSQTLSRVS